MKSVQVRKKQRQEDWKNLGEYDYHLFDLHNESGGIDIIKTLKNSKYTDLEHKLLRMNLSYDEKEDILVQNILMLKTNFSGFPPG